MSKPNEAVEAAAQALWQVHPLTRENVHAAARRALHAVHRTQPATSERVELARVLAAAEGWERQDITTDVFEDYLETAAAVLAAGFRKVDAA